RSAILSVYIFFQAEDGIRDDLVTGVQTCALPISGGRRFKSCLPDSRSPARPGGLVAVRARSGPHRRRRPGRRELRRDGAGVRDEIGRASCRERGERWWGRGGLRE